LAQGFGRKEQALSYFDQILLTWPSVHNDIPDVLQQRAILYEENGDHVLALRDYERALEIRHERFRENLLGIASINSNIGMLQSTKSNFQTSITSHKEALNIYEQLYGTKKDHLTKAKVNENIGLVYYNNGSAIEANEYFMRAWAIYSRILPRRHLFLVQLLGYIGAVHEAINNSTLAVKFFHRQLNWSENILPPDHPLLITCLDSVLRVHTKFNQSSNISVLFSEYFDNFKKMLGERHPVIPRLLVMVAFLFESTQPIKAIELYEQALSISQDLTPIDRNTMFRCHKNLAQLYRKSKNMNAALSHAIEAFIYQQQLSVETQNHSLEADELHNIGSIYLEMGLPTNALHYLSKSLTIYRSTYAHDHPNVQAVLASIIQAANQNGSYT
jgi:tetratricopeptide (TPR) repeat protein